ncbi:MAG: hypothetical protein AB1756_09875 [Acidobacteriota bacterium]
MEAVAEHPWKRESPLKEFEAESILTCFVPDAAGIGFESESVPESFSRTRIGGTGIGDIGEARYLMSSCRYTGLKDSRCSISLMGPFTWERINDGMRKIELKATYNRILYLINASPSIFKNNI